MAVLDILHCQQIMKLYNCVFIDHRSRTYMRRCVIEIISESFLSLSLFSAVHFILIYIALVLLVLAYGS